MVQCNLILDSCCDLPFQVVDRPGVTVLNFPYIVDGDVIEDDMYQTLTARDFYDSMRNGSQPSTCQIPLPAMKQAFDDAAKSGVPTVFLAFSSGLSGTFGTAEMLLEQTMQEYPEAEIHLVDTRLGSIAEGFLVYEAFRQRERGLSATELAEWAREARYYVNCAFMLDDLEALRRGGRIPSSVAYAGSKLDVKPLLTFDLDGKLTLCGVARGRKKGIKQLVDYYEKHSSDHEVERNVVVADADCPKDLLRLKDLLTKFDENTLFLETQIGPVIGSHVGPGMLALVFWGPDRREEISVADRIAKRVTNRG